MIVVAVIAVNAFYPGKYLNRAVRPVYDDEKMPVSSQGSKSGSARIAPQNAF
jgi:hypothetical protein